MSKFAFCVGLVGLFNLANAGNAQSPLPKEQPLWTKDVENEIRYPDGEQVRNANPSKTSPSGSNRVFSQVATPTYFIHRPNAEKANGIGLVICPGGGYKDVWLDREGHDLAIWLKEYGITSLVLKYRTNADGDIDGRKYAWDNYLPNVIEDARQAVRTLRVNANQLNLDRNKIGVSGFSAGGNLAMLVALTFDETNSVINGDANFAGLFYPWLRTDAYQALVEKRSDNIPPLFIMNAADDRVTPPDRCIDFYARLLAAKAKPELHIVSKGGHGFDLGDGKGQSAAIWKHSFVAWLKDVGLTHREKSRLKTIKP